MTELKVSIESDGKGHRFQIDIPTGDEACERFIEILIDLAGQIARQISVKIDGDIQDKRKS